MLSMTEAESPLAFLGEPLTAEKGVLDRIRFSQGLWSAHLAKSS
jgi:hypothetical protein